MGIGGQGYPSLGDGEPFKKAWHSKDNQSFLDAWASRSAIWGTRHGIGESLDRYMGLHRPAFASDFSKQFAELGIDRFEGKDAGALSYSNILKLESNHVAWRDLSWKSFKDTVKENIKPLQDHLKSASPKTFFQDVTSKAYAKEILWEGNLRPFKELFSGSRQNLFMNLGYGVGVGLSGVSVIKTGVQHYRYWKQRENGSFSSRVKTIYETAKATGQKVMQSMLPGRPPVLAWPLAVPCYPSVQSQSVEFWWVPCLPPRLIRQSGSCSRRCLPILQKVSGFF